jgi:transcription initiation factor TFIIE subunit alpha
MLNKFLKEVVVLVVGRQAEEIADLLNSKKHVNEFNIAKKLNLTINQTRNILYKISDYGLVSSVRKKDKKKGWYTYFWRFEVLKCLEFLKKGVVLEVQDLDAQINIRKSKLHYYCERCKVEYDEDQALLMDFSCNECGDIFSVKDDLEFVKGLEKEKEKLVSKIILIDKEIEKEISKLGKEKDKQIKKREKEEEERKKVASEKRKAKREATRKRKEKENPKSAKKKITKKKITKKKITKKKITKKKVVKKKSSSKK